MLDRTEFHLESPGATFAARDVLAPVAAHLCNGTDLADLGTPIDPALLLPGLIPLPREEGGVLHGEITWVDRFGNCQLNIGPDDVAAWGPRLRVTLGDAATGSVRSLGVVTAFGDIGAGAPGLVVDASGMLAIALDGRRRPRSSVSVSATGSSSAPPTTSRVSPRPCRSAALGRNLDPCVPPPHSRSPCCCSSSWALG